MKLNPQNIVHPADVAFKHWQTIKDRKGKPPELPIKTLPALNNKLWGLSRKKLVVVGGRPSQGKSVWLLQIAYDFASQGFRVVFFSYEMSKEVCVERIICNQIKIDNFLLRTGNIDENTDKKVNLFYIDKLKKTKFIIVESIGNTLPSFSQILNVFGNKRPDIVVIDYGNMVSAGPRQTRKEAMDEFIKGVRALAIHNNFCAIMGAQINRTVHEGGKMREPQVWMLKETGEFEQVADTIFLLHWPWLYDNSLPKNDYIIKVGKNRDGRTGRFECLFYPEFYKIVEK